MSVIGPRPGLWNQDILTAERDKYNANDVKPGLTGWAQINGRDELEIPDKAKLDIQNIKEGGKPILLMASSFENEEEYEVIDDKNIHSKRCDVYDYVNGEIVQVGSIFSLSGYLSLYTKATEEYIATRINTHSVYFTCIKDDKLYTYGYNTNNIQEDTVDHEEDKFICSIATVECSVTKFCF